MLCRLWSAAVPAIGLITAITVEPLHAWPPAGAAAASAGAAGLAKWYLRYHPREELGLRGWSRTPLLGTDLASIGDDNSGVAVSAERDPVTGAEVPYARYRSQRTQRLMVDWLG